MANILLGIIFEYNNKEMEIWRFTSIVAREAMTKYMKFN